MCKINGNGTTLENIHRAAKAEFLEKGYKDASLRNIVKSVGMTTGAFYGYYKSKEELFEAIVGEHYEYILKRFIKAQQEFAELPAAQQPEVMSDISGLCMYDMLHYAYEHLEECKLILCCSEGTKFARLIDEMVEIEVEGTHAYQEVFKEAWKALSAYRSFAGAYSDHRNVSYPFFEFDHPRNAAQRCRKLRQRNARLLYSGMDENYGAVMPYNFYLVVS